MELPVADALPPLYLKARARLVRALPLVDTGNRWFLSEPLSRGGFGELAAPPLLRHL